MITPEGDYLSNLKAPDLRPYFKHLHWRKMGHSMGHLVASDWADKADDDPTFGIYKNCGLWTRDEAAILYNVAQTQAPGDWLDIGCHTGWTSFHIAYAHEPIAVGNYVRYCDPVLHLFNQRLIENSKTGDTIPGVPQASTSAEFFAQERIFFANHGGPQCIRMRDKEKVDWIPGCFTWVHGKGFGEHIPDFTPTYKGVCIDGDHEPGKPLEDAQNAARHLADTGVIIFHDFIGAPVREAVTWLMDQSFKARVYWTPHLVACCWRGDFIPPDHEGDPRIDWTAHRAEMSRDFDFGWLS